MQRQVVFRAFRVAHLRLFIVFKGKEVGMHGHTVKGVHLQVVPFGKRWPSHHVSRTFWRLHYRFYLALCYRTFRLALRPCVGLCLQAKGSQCHPK